MRTRLWLIILLLVWTAQSILLNTPPVQGACRRAIWFLREDLVALVVIEASRPALEPRFCTSCRVRRQRSGRKRQCQRPRAKTVQEDQEVPTEKAWKAKNKSIFDPQRWGLTPEWSEGLPERLRGLGAILRVL